MEQKDYLAVYFNNVFKEKLPTKEEERLWFQQYLSLPEGVKKQQVRDKIARGYLRFVIKKARYWTKNETLLDELIAAGNLGLLKAIDGFNLKFETRFLTYGAWWINVEIQNVLYKNLVNVPQQIVKARNKIRQIENVEMSRGKRTQYSFEDITITPIEKVVIPDTREPTLDSVWWLKNMTAAKLTLRERIFLILQYGLRGGNPQALSDIAKIVEGLEGQAPSKEGLKKLRDSALRKLRNYLKD